MNILHLKLSSLNSVWEVVKAIRKNFLTEFNENTQCSNVDPSLLSDNIIQNNFEKVTDKLSVTVALDPLVNITNETFQTAAEMFTYLNFCPPKLFLLFKKLFKSESPKKILLAMTSILKASQSTAKQSSGKIWAKVKEYLPPLYSQHDDRSFKKCKLKRETGDSNCGRFWKTIGCLFFNLFSADCRCMFI